MIRTMIALVVLLGIGAMAPLGPQGLGDGLVAAGALLSALALLFASCLLVGYVGSRHGVDGNVDWGARRRPGVFAAEAAARSTESPGASRRLAA